MTRRAMVRTGARVALGVVTLAVGAGVIAGAAHLPLPTLGDTPAGRVVTPVALDQQRACSGSLLRLSGGAGAAATTVSAVGSASTVSATGTGARATSTPLTGADGSTSSPSLVTTPATGGSVPLVAGAESQKASESDLSGLAVAPCVEPTNSTWLVGGSTETGRTTLIDLVNASDVNSTVDLAVWGENGSVQGPGLTGIVVGPKSQKVVPLSGFATNLASPVVHVTSRGGLIAANLQVGVVRTLAPGGADIVSAAAAPSRKVSIPGIVVGDVDAIDSKTSEAGFSDLKTVLRAFVPGTANAQLSIQLGSTAGTGATFSVTAQAGQVTDIPLDGLPEGRYTATVMSSVPIVGGVRTSTLASSGDIDLAWVGAATPLTGSMLFVAAPGPRPTLTLANPTGRAITATLTQIRGSGARNSPVKIAVAAGSSVVTSIVGTNGQRLSDATGLTAAMSYNEEGQLAAYALASPTAVSSPVKVYP